MEDAKEYTEMVLNDIGNHYNIDPSELQEKYLYYENENVELGGPIINYTIKIVDGKTYFKDEYCNIYDEQFKYIEKEENKRKREKKPKKNQKIKER